MTSTRRRNPDTGYGEFDELVGIRAYELNDIGTLVGELADYLAQASQSAQDECTRYFANRGGHTPHSIAAFCAHIHRRSTDLLGLDQPPRMSTPEPDNLDQPIPVPHHELLEWAWLASEIADWLRTADDNTRAEFTRYFANLRDPEQVTDWLTRVQERIETLLNTPPERRLIPED